MCVVEKRVGRPLSHSSYSALYSPPVCVCVRYSRREKKRERKKDPVLVFILFGSPVVGVCVCEIGAPLFSFHLVVIRFTKE